MNESPTESVLGLGSEASSLALDTLRALLIELGFSVRKRAHRELTLRVYPNGFGRYPLLNPRFEPTASTLGPKWSRECLVFTVLSRGHGETLDRSLGMFTSTDACTFVPDAFERNEYRYHGYFVLPLQFLRTLDHAEFDFESLKLPLGALRNFLQCNA